MKSKKFFKNHPQNNVVKKELPKISLKIPDAPQKIILLSFVSIILLLSIILVVFNVKNLLVKKEVIDSGRSKVLEQISYWNSVVEKRADYRDGYFQLSVLSYQIGKKDDAIVYLEKALQIDPNFEEGRKLEKILNEE